MAAPLRTGKVVACAAVAFPAGKLRESGTLSARSAMMFGAAGALMTTIADAAPALAQAFTLLAFTIVIVGGLGSMTGALIGGLLIGVSEALASFYLAPSMKP